MFILEKPSKFPKHGQKQVCRNYDVISIMMLIVNSRVLEKFQIFNMHFQSEKNLN